MINKVTITDHFNTVNTILTCLLDLIFSLSALHSCISI